jgi:hypothetical protein
MVQLSWIADPNDTNARAGACLDRVACEFLEGKNVEVLRNVHAIK